MGEMEDTVPQTESGDTEFMAESQAESEVVQAETDVASVGVETVDVAEEAAPVEAPALSEEPTPAEVVDAEPISNSAEQDQLDLLVADLEAPENPAAAEVAAAALVADSTDAPEAATPEAGDEQPADTAAPDSFDDIPAAVVAAEPEVSLPHGFDASDATVPWWPYLVYLGAWVVLASAAVWQLMQLPTGQVAYESTAYSLTILGGLIMMAVGPLLIFAVWFGTRANHSADNRTGLLTSALLKGALVTLSGAIVWWAALVIVDYLRLGRLL
jgi:hypothetical protein